MDFEKVKEILDSLDSVVRDQVYRYLWADYVKEDVQNALDVYIESGDLSEKDADMVKADVVERIVDEGDLDSNISYNQNIDNFVEEAMFLIEQKNKLQDKSDKADIDK